MMNNFQNLVPNSNLRPLLAELKFHDPASRTERHHPPAGPASTQEILIPCAGSAPPLQQKSAAAGARAAAPRSGSSQRVFRSPGVGAVMSRTARWGPAWPPPAGPGGLAGQPGPARLGQLAELVWDHFGVQNGIVGHQIMNL